jgi:hypothetical protein
MQNPVIKARMLRHKQEAERAKRSRQAEGQGDTTQTADPEQYQEPMLNTPDFLDYQDFVSPVFRLDLYLRKEEGGLDLSMRPRSAESEEIRFSRRDEDILSAFDALVDSIVCSFADFCSPEFCKVSELVTSDAASVEPTPAHNEAAATAKKHEPYPGILAEPHGIDPATYTCGVQQDFTELLYPGVEMGPEVFARFMGRIRVTESDRAVKGFRREYTGAASFLGQAGSSRAPTYIDRYLRVADRDEECYRLAKADIRAAVSAHLRDTKRVLEIYEQFEPILKGALAARVNRALSQLVEDQLIGRAADKVYAGLIKEVRRFQTLSGQLPTIIFLPMFEVGVNNVKEEIQRRIEGILTGIFEHYEATYIASARALCGKYSAICARLRAPLTTPDEVVEMERYKVGLLAEMARVQSATKGCREQVFFLLRADWPPRPETEALVLQLHTWPDELDEQIHACEE